jgi:1,4-dihydroxy-2-naphthoate octaprenyltransferase
MKTLSIEEADIKNKIWVWISLARLPFHTVGILPFILGTLLAWKIEHAFDKMIFSLGVLAVILIMLSTYHAGEYFDYKEDTISKRIYKSRFAGGTGVIPSGIIPRHPLFWTSLVTIIIAGLLGIILQFFFKTGSYTIPLGAIGLFSGFFYSTRPVRFVERGIGELLIGLCYGWLPIAVAFYIQTGCIASIIHWMALPVGSTIFNVMLLNEFPDYIADKTVGKKNMLVRLGMRQGVVIYSAASILAWVTMLLSIKAGVPVKVLFFYLPVMALSAAIIIEVIKKEYENSDRLEVLCGLNIVVNLGTTLAYLLAYI